MGIISVNMKKIKASTNVNSLLGENYRTDQDAKKYDDGHRNIATEKTVDNVFLIDRPENYDRERREKINRVNEARANRPNDDRLMLKKNLKKHDKLKSTNNQNIASHRKLRSDTVDTIGEVVQPDADFVNGLSHDDQIRFFSDALAVIRDNPDYFGQPETAVIHFDETTPHMQVLASTLNETTLTSDARKIMGNKSKMSQRQDVLAKGMQAKGWDVERGMKRVDNPEYQNWKSEAEAKGFEVTRNNDRQLQRQMAQADAEAAQKRREADKYLTEAKSSYGATTADLDAREQQLREKEEQVQHNDSINKTNAEKLKEYQTALNGREKSLEKRETALTGRESSLEAREGDLEDKDRQADEKLSEASRMRQMAENLLKQVEQAKKQFENMKERFEKTWERVLKQVKRGDLKPEAVEEHVKKYDPLTMDKMTDMTNGLDDLSKSVDNDNQIDM